MTPIRVRHGVQDSGRFIKRGIWNDIQDIEGQVYNATDRLWFFSLPHPRLLSARSHVTTPDVILEDDFTDASPGEMAPPGSSPNTNPAWRWNENFSKPNIYDGLSSLRIPMEPGKGIKQYIDAPVNVEAGKSYALVFVFTIPVNTKGGDMQFGFAGNTDWNAFGGREGSSRQCGFFVSTRNVGFTNWLSGPLDGHALTLVNDTPILNEAPQSLMMRIDESTAITLWQYNGDLRNPASPLWVEMTKRDDLFDDAAADTFMMPMGPNHVGVNHFYRLKDRTGYHFNLDYVALFELPDPVAGERYEVTMPDTLDLAWRAGLAIRPITEQPGKMGCQNTVCSTKMSEALPLLRVMSGSTRNLTLEKRNLQKYVFENMGDDGLLYLGQDDAPNGMWACVTAQGLLVRGMGYYNKIKEDPIWPQHMKRMMDGLKRITILKEDYAYYPSGAVMLKDKDGHRYWLQEPFSYLKNGGWENTREPVGALLSPPYFSDPNQRAGRERDGHWFDGRFGIQLYYAGAIEGLLRWHDFSGDETSLDYAGRLVRFVTRPKFWDTFGFFPELEKQYGDAAYSGHLHGHVAMLRALLMYAVLMNDDDLKQFVRNGYEFTRHFSSAEIGYFNEWTLCRAGCETCEIADMIALAIRLSDAGIGDYWDDVDSYVRNQFVEQQHVTGPDFTIGSFVIGGRPTWIPEKQVAGCCTSNGSKGLYYAWESIMRQKDGHASVNLLMNRVSSGVDILSHLPYEGKVEFKIKQVDSVDVRIPGWVERRSVGVTVNDESVMPNWNNRRIVIPNLESGDNVVIRFPMVYSEKKITLCDPTTPVEYTYEFKGNTVVDVNPRPEIRPAVTDRWGKDRTQIYMRGHYRKDRAPMVKKTVFIPDEVIEW
jgi:hypothetical protein